MTSGTGPIGRGEYAVLGLTLVYVAGFSAWFIGRGNWEFLIYVATLAILIAVIGANLRKAAFPLPMLWALSAWGFLHMAGGGVPVGDGVLYGAVLVPITSDGANELTLLKYDQVVHAYGYGVAAWVLRHLLIRHHPATRGSWTAVAFPVLASMGLGTVNEMIEFTAVLATPENGVGGYGNTMLDLVFNALGATVAVAVCAAADRRGAPAG
jgi:putative membrane protein